MSKYTAEITEGNVSISRNGIWACDGRLDTVCLERGEAHIVDAEAPLGDDVFEALDDALTEAIANGKTSASVTI